MTRFGLCSNPSSSCPFPGGSAEEALAAINKSRRDKSKKAITLAGIKLKDSKLELPIKTIDGKVG